MSEPLHEPWTVWGVDLSYFTGKLEAMLRAKGVVYERKAITMRSWPRLARKTGVQHIPIVVRADGSVMSDTTLIHRWLEEHHPGPTLTPATPDARFLARVIEDWADESLWRPAMHWRWKSGASRRMQATRIAEQAGADDPIPLRLGAVFMAIRQYGFYVWGDGVRTAAQREASDRIYFELLDVLDPIFARRPYLLGERPTEADFGLFGPFFRHFFGDPLPGPIMQDRAPNLLHGLTRLWAIRPESFSDAAPLTEVPDDLDPLLGIVVRDHLPYLRANANAVAAGKKRTRYRMHGVDWSEFTKPFRLWCFAELQREFRKLDTDAQAKVGARLGDAAIRELTEPLPCDPVAPPALPIAADRDVKVRDSWMR